MAQAGILATGSWDKTLKVRGAPFSHPTQFVVSYIPSFPSTWSLTLGKHAPNQVLGPSIAQPACHSRTQGQMLRNGREEPGSRSRNRGPTRPDI